MDPMNRDDARRIALQALFLQNHTEIAGDVTRNIASFSKLLAEALRLVVPERTVSVVGPNTILISDENRTGEGWHGTVDVRQHFDSLSQTNPAANMEILLGLIAEMHARASIWRSKDSSNFATEFDLEKLVLIPKLGSTARAGAEARQYLNVPEQPDEGLIRRPVYGYVHAVPTINHPDRFVYPQTKLLPMLGLTEDELFDRGKENIRRLASTLRIEIGAEEMENGFMIEGMEGVVSSLLFLPEFWASIAERMGSQIIVHAVSHEQLIVVPEKQRLMIMNMLIATARGELGALLPATFFTYDDEGFRIFGKFLPDNA